MADPARTTPRRTEPPTAHRRMGTSAFQPTHRSADERSADLAQIHRRAANASPAALLHLQRRSGNQAVLKLLQGRRDEDALPEPLVAYEAQRPPDRRTGSPPNESERPPADRQLDGAAIVQRHSSWEHRLLGDVDPATLQVITDVNEFESRPFTRRLVSFATGETMGEQRTEAIHALTQQLENLRAWQDSPPGPGTTHWRGTRLVTIELEEGGSVVCTVGEMNTLADYYANVEQLRRGRQETLQRILQTVRKQSFERLRGVLRQIDPIAGLTMRAPEFEGAIATSGKRSDAELQNLTADGRNRMSETYLANVARNACHFAPQSWHRWREHHERALALARSSWRTKQKADREDNPDLRRNAASLANEAVMVNGFGDHYLQDSFAAGHLINKTLIMQWFVDWLGAQNSIEQWLDSSMGSRYIRAWAQVKNMSTAQQPGLAGTDRYDKRATGGATDPQSAEEEPTRERRIARLGLAGADREQAYRDYLEFLNNTAIQQAAGNLHDHFCQNGLKVLAGDTEIGLVYGDDNMIKGGQGVGYSAETAKMSREAIEKELEGKSGESVEVIMARLPDKVQIGDGEPISLAAWHSGGQLREFCEANIFPDVNYRVLGQVPFPPVAGEVSQDVPRGTEPAGMPDLANWGPVVRLRELAGKARDIGRLVRVRVIDVGRATASKAREIADETVARGRALAAEALDLGRQAGDTARGIAAQIAAGASEAVDRVLDVARRTGERLGRGREALAGAAGSVTRLLRGAARAVGESVSNTSRLAEDAERRAGELAETSPAAGTATEGAEDLAGDDQVPLEPATGSAGGGQRHGGPF